MVTKTKRKISIDSLMSKCWYSGSTLLMSKKIILLNIQILFIYFFWRPTMAGVDFVDLHLKVMVSP